MGGPSEKISLMTPNPYHVPGYGGFCPQFKYKIGNTFGRTTSNLLRDNEIAASGKLVLADISAGSKQGLDAQREAERKALIKNRKQSWGDQKLTGNLVPGYTGFIPRSQHYFGKRYANNSINAISDFEGAQQRHISKIQELRDLESLQCGQTPSRKGSNLPTVFTKYHTPLKSNSNNSQSLFISKDREWYQSMSMSPLYMDNDNPAKKYMSGYTGFIPRSRNVMGVGYPKITHDALNEFTDSVRHQKELAGQKIQVERPAARPQPATRIYPVQSGFVPHYTGHIPGERFRFGQTFGHSTTDALGVARVAVSAN